MRRLYTILIYLGLPLILLRILWKSLRNPDYRLRISERFGIFPSLAADRSIWVHAVSVGEAQAAEPMIRWLLDQYPHTPVVVTTTTPTGSERVRALFGESVFHVYFPYDIPLAIRGFLSRVRPLMLVMVETEIWPNLIEECHRNNIPTLLANARLSEKSARGYARLGSFTREIFGKIGLIAAQAPVDAERFLGLGVPHDRVRVTGSIKFDIKLNASLHEQAEVLRRSWGHRPIWVAASTHEGEEEQILAAHNRILLAHTEALLVLVPRHPERFERVHALCVQQGFSVAKRYSMDHCGLDKTVLLGDTMGELMLFYATADAAFVGGSLVSTGGHNVLEPAALGVPVLFGPHMFNFSVISRLLLAENAAVQIANTQALAEVLVRWFSDASERTRIGENALRVVEANKGALERLVELIKELLDGQVSGA
ncbi:MAG: 3-deoxy-D-manno-octulosonic acid transferase [Sedimenticola sp.]|nr:MAG: 3-deoxy-D-manno-octulosonic acid transferase [Sedimenticola sp.]